MGIARQDIMDVDAAIGVDALLPAWMLIIGATAALVTTVLTAIVGLHKWVVMPLVGRVDLLRTEVRGWSETTDLVHANAPKWDEAAAQFQAAAAALVEVSERLSGVQEDIAEIRAQVTIDDGDSLKDQVIAQRMRGDERHAALDDRLDRLESFLTAQAARAEQQHPNTR